MNPYILMCLLFRIIRQRLVDLITTTILLFTLIITILRHRGEICKIMNQFAIDNDEDCNTIDAASHCDCESCYNFDETIGLSEILFSDSISNISYKSVETLNPDDDINALYVREIARKNNAWQWTWQWIQKYIPAYASSSNNTKFLATTNQELFTTNYLGIRGRKPIH